MNKTSNLPPKRILNKKPGRKYVLSICGKERKRLQGPRYKFKSGGATLYTNSADFEIFLEF